MAKRNEVMGKWLKKISQPGFFNAKFPILILLVTN